MSDTTQHTAESPNAAWGARFRRLLHRRGVTAYQLADRANVNHSVIFRAMSGDTEMTQEVMRKCAAALGMSAGELMDL